MLGELFSVGSGNRNAVKDSINSHIAETLLLGERNTKFVKRFQQLWIHFIQACFLVLLLGGRIVNNILVINFRKAKPDQSGSGI